MTAEEIFKNSVGVMNRLLTSRGMVQVIKRIKGYSQRDNLALLDRQRVAINELVRKIADAGGSGDALKEAGEELTDGLVLRYLRNREIFMKTFPEGIDAVDTDAVSLWAAMMISPLDEKVGE